VLRYETGERGPHHSIWRKVVETTNARGQLQVSTNQAYIELSSGLNYRDARGEWTQSSDLVESFPGGAIARHAQHQVIFANNLNTSGAIDMQTPDGKRLRSNLIGLMYCDLATGKSAVIARVQDSEGGLVSTNQVLYGDALEGVLADVCYVFRRDGFEQNVILRQRPPSAESYGFDPETTVLEVLTEFIDPPQTDIAEGQAGSYGEQADQQIGWGAMKLVPGKAFDVQDEDAAAPVVRRFETIAGRHFLLEKVRLKDIKAALDKLPEQASLDRRLPALASRDPVLPDAPPPKAVAKPIRLAMADKPSKGYVLDYNTVNSTLTDCTFQSDTTYFVSGVCALYGTTTIEGGAVIKYNTNQISLGLYGPLNCKTTDYRQAICTSKDDDTVGDAISGSTGSPVRMGSSGATAISYSPSGGNGLVARGLSMRYVTAGIVLNSSSTTNLISDCQFAMVYRAIMEGAGEKLSIDNVLVYGAMAAFVMYDPGCSLSGANLTLHNLTRMVTELQAAGFARVALTNTLLIGVTNWFGTSTGTVLSDPFTSYNCVTNASDAGIFQTVGAGSHYLAPDSPYRNAGTTNINPDTLAGLRQKTTYPPLVYSNALISVDTTLAPQAQRDTDLPDLGYHYCPLDYAFKQSRVTNATLRFLPGTAIATFGPYGIGIWAGSRVICEGTPTSLNHIVRFNLVQECSTTNWGGWGSSICGDWCGGTTPGVLSCRFTDWAMPAQDGHHFVSQQYDTLNSFSDCEFHGGLIRIERPSCNLTNCLLERVNTILNQDTYGLDMAPVVRNCLLLGGTLAVTHENSDVWLFRDNLFDQTSLPLNDYGPRDTDNAYNGYTPGSDRLTPTNANDIVASITYQSGPLGNYYQPTNSAFVTNGSIAASLVGLYHYTVLTNQLKETTNLVSRGFHYVAVDANPNPVDGDSDGVPDYLEDANGNGLVDSGETDWQSASDLGLKVLITRPKNGSSPVP
jgi:hypothetical protein